MRKTLYAGSFGRTRCVLIRALVEGPFRFAQLRRVAQDMEEDGLNQVESSKIHIGFRLTADGVRGTGKDYSARIGQVLWEAFVQGKLRSRSGHLYFYPGSKISMGFR